MVVPPTLRLFTAEGFYRVLPSIEELWVCEIPNWDYVSFACPNLQVLKVQVFGEKPVPERLLPLLRKRKETVESGLEAGGVQMELLKKLVVPFNQLSDEKLEQYRELVGEIVDLKSEPELWEVEI